QQRLGFGRWITDDDDFAATEVELGQRVLVRHPGRERERVVQRVLLRAVRVEADAPEGGAQHGGVHRDNRPQACRRVLTENDLFVTAVAVEYTFGHGDGSFVWLSTTCGRHNPGFRSRRAPAWHGAVSTPASCQHGMPEPGVTAITVR